jgi:hypothetical protein
MFTTFIFTIFTCYHLDINIKIQFYVYNVYIYNVYIYIQMITCIGNTKSRHRCTACNISASGRVRATDPLY